VGGQTRAEYNKGALNPQMTILMKSYLYTIMCNPPNEVIIRPLWTGMITVFLVLIHHQQLRLQ